MLDTLLNDGSQKQWRTVFRSILSGTAQRSSFVTSCCGSLKTDWIWNVCGVHDNCVLPLLGLKASNFVLPSYIMLAVPWGKFLALQVLPAWRIWCQPPWPDALRCVRVFKCGRSEFSTCHCSFNLHMQWLHVVRKKSCPNRTPQTVTKMKISGVLQVTILSILTASYASG